MENVGRRLTLSDDEDDDDEDLMELMPVTFSQLQGDDSNDFKDLMPQSFSQQLRPVPSSEGQATSARFKQNGRFRRKAVTKLDISLEFPTWASEKQNVEKQKVVNSGCVRSQRNERRKTVTKLDISLPTEISSWESERLVVEEEPLLPSSFQSAREAEHATAPSKVALVDSVVSDYLRAQAELLKTPSAFFQPKEQESPTPPSNPLLHMPKRSLSQNLYSVLKFNHHFQTEDTDQSKGAADIEDTTSHKDKEQAKEKEKDSPGEGVYSSTEDSPVVKESENRKGKDVVEVVEEEKISSSPNETSAAAAEVAYSSISEDLPVAEEIRGTAHSKITEELPVIEESENTEEMPELVDGKTPSPPPSKKLRRKPKRKELQLSPFLTDAGTVWEDGKRRSTRYKSKPLEHWRGEKLLYGRIHKTMVTLIGVKHSSPSPSLYKRGAKPKAFKVDSFVSDQYQPLVRFAAL